MPKHLLLILLIFTTLGFAKANDSLSVAGEDKIVVNDKISLSAIYPNPSTGGAVYLDYSIADANIKTVSVKLFNVLGEKVQEVTLDPLKNQLTINTSDLNAGLYFYSISYSGNVVATKRLIVKK